MTDTALTDAAMTDAAMTDTGRTRTLGVVVPVRDAAGQLPVLIGLLGTQTVPVDEILVVDDGSTDDTAAVAVGLGAVVLPNPGRGPYAGRNAGWSRLATDLVGFLDVRSRPEPGWAEAVRRLFDDPPVDPPGSPAAAVALATTGTVVVGGGSTAELAAVGQQIFDVAGYVDRPWFLPYYATCNLTVRRDVLVAVEGFDAGRSGGDADLCFRVQLAGHGSLAVDRRPLMRWQARTGLVSSCEQQMRYGRSNAALRRRYQGAGAVPLRVERLSALVPRAVRAALALAVRDLRGDRQQASRNLRTLWDVLYSVGYLREQRSGRRSGA